MTISPLDPDQRSEIARYIDRGTPNDSFRLEPDPGVPLHAFPPAIAAWLETIAAETRVPAVMTALPFLAFTGAAIGSQLRLEVGPGWFERPALWVALITLTGIGKTPAIAATRQPFDRLHHEAWIQWRTELAAWNSAPEPRADRPGFNRLFTTSATLASLTTALADSTGLCLLRDELYGLVRAMDRRGGEDRQHFLTLWSSEPLLPTRPDAASYVPNPVVSIVGGLQPMLLPKIRRKEQDGFLERFLLAFVAGIVPQWSETPSAPPDREAVLALLRPLRAIPSSQGDPYGRTVTRTPDAAAIWAEWFAGNIDQTLGAALIPGGFYRKMPSHLARIALILHALWNPHDPTVPLTGETMRGAIDLVEYFRVHLHRSIPLIGERHTLRSPFVSLGARIIRVLGGATEDEGWLTHSNLLVALGRPDTADFNNLMEGLVEKTVIETRTIGTAGRSATAYRIRQ